MRDGLARPWVGWHAAAYALNAFLGACLYNLIDYRLDWSLSAWPHLTQALFLGVPLGGAQMLSTWGRRFPVPASAWILMTATATGLASCAGHTAMGIYIRTVMLPIGRAHPDLDRVLGYGMVVAMLSASAAVSSGGQALGLLWKANAKTAGLWWAWAGGAVFACDLAGFACGWLGLIPGEVLPKHLDLESAVFGTLLAAAQGTLLALLTLPLFRKLAPPEA